MLSLLINKAELFDEDRMVFYNIPDTKILLEYSLDSIDKWESKYKKPFLSSTKNYTEFIDAIKFMTLNQAEVNPLAYLLISEDDINTVKEYMEEIPTASIFPPSRKKSSNFVTSEMIYAWMAGYQIPFECRFWNLNKLMTIIRACSAQNEPAKKMSRQDIYNRQRQLNEVRRRQMRSKG